MGKKVIEVQNKKHIEKIKKKKVLKILFTDILLFGSMAIFFLQNNKYLITSKDKMPKVSDYKKEIVQVRNVILGDGYYLVP